MRMGLIKTTRENTNFSYWINSFKIICPGASLHHEKQLLETIPDSTKQLPLSSLRSEIEHLREENRTKTLIIKQFTENKAMTCSYNVVSTSKGHVDKNNKEYVNSLENNEKSNKNFNPTKKPDEKTLTDHHNTENKDSNEKSRKTITEKKNDTEKKDTKEDKNVKKKTHWKQGRWREQGD